MPDLGSIDWLGVLIAVVVAQVLGFLWYGPLFGKRWMAAVGKTREEIQADGPGAAIAVSIVASILHAVGIAIILAMSDTPDLVSGVKIGLLASVGFAAAAAVTNSMFEGRPPILLSLYAGYLVLSITVMGAIIGAMS